MQWAPLLLLVLAYAVSSCAGGDQQRLKPVVVARADEMVLQLECQPGVAEVSIDGVFHGTCADLARQRLHLSSGGHRLQVRAPGYRTFSGVVEARGMLQKLSVRLSELSPQ